MPQCTLMHSVVVHSICSPLQDCLILFCVGFQCWSHPLRGRKADLWIVVGEGSSRGAHCRPTPCSLHASTLRLCSFLDSPEMLLPAFHVTTSLFYTHCHFVCWPCHAVFTLGTDWVMAQWPSDIQKKPPPPSGKRGRRAEIKVCREGLASLDKNPGQ